MKIIAITDNMNKKFEDYCIIEGNRNWFLPNSCNTSENKIKNISFLVIKYHVPNRIIT